MIIFLLIKLVFAVEIKRALEGFLSGFQNTDVYIKATCISNQEDFFNYLSQFSNHNLEEKIKILYQEWHLIKGIATDCHLVEFGELFFYLIGLDRYDFLLHTVLNVVPICKQVSIDDFGKGIYESSNIIGKITRIWVNTENNLPESGLGDIFLGLMQGLAQRPSEKCQQSMKNIQNSLNSIQRNDYSELKSGIVISLTNYNELIQICNLKYAIDGIFDNLNLTGYIKLGMNLTKISAFVSKIVSNYHSKNFYDVGLIASEILKIIIV